MLDITSMVINSIWTDQFVAKKTKLVSIRVFIQEVLRRSRTTYSTLQTALFYLFRVKNAIVTRLRERAAREAEQRTSAPGQCSEDDLIGCGRRMFLAALMVASKYLQDKNYRNRAWAKISGLSVNEINATEIAFLKLIDYNLFVSKPTFDRWYMLLHAQVASANANKDDQQTPICLASDALFFSTSPVDHPVDRLASPPESLCSPPPRVPSPSQTSSSSVEMEESDPDFLRSAKEARTREYVQTQIAPDSGIAFYMPTPEPTDSMTLNNLAFQQRPIVRPRNPPAASAQSSNHVVVAPNKSGVHLVVRSTSAAAHLPSPPESGKRKHAETSLDEGYESAGIQVPDVCSVSAAKKSKTNGEAFEDLATVEPCY